MVKVPKTTSAQKVMLAVLMAVVGWCWNMVQRLTALETSMGRLHLEDRMEDFTVLETRFDFFYGDPTPEELEARRENMRARRAAAAAAAEK